MDVINRMLKFVKEKYKNIKAINDIDILQMKKKTKRKKMKNYKIIGIILFFVLINILYVISIGNNSISIPRLNSISNVKVIAPFTYDIIKSDDEMKEEKNQIIGKVFPIVSYNGEVTKKLLKDLKKFKLSILGLSIESEKKQENLAKSLEFISKKNLDVFRSDTVAFKFFINELSKRIKKGVLDVYFASSEKEYREFQAYYKNSAIDIEKFPSKYIEVHYGDSVAVYPSHEFPVFDVAIEQIFNKIREYYYSDGEFVNAIHEFLSGFLKPNMNYNKLLTKIKITNSIKSLSNVKGKVIKGYKIVDKNELVSKSIYEKLLNLKRAYESKTWNDKIRFYIFYLFKILIFDILIFFMLKGLRLVNRELLIIGKIRLFFSYLSMIVLAILINLLFKYISLEILDNIIRNSKIFAITLDIDWYYLVPVAVIPIIISLFVSSRTAIYTIVFLSFCNSIFWDYNIVVFIYSFLLSFVVVLLMKKIRYISHFIWYIFLYLSVVGMVLFLLMESFKFQVTSYSLISNIAILTVSNVITIFLSLLLVVFYQKVSNQATNIWLLELSDINSPLLKELSIKAPGTYHHSIMVGQLAEAGADAIGANSLLVGVAALYHDIGKLFKSGYFVENQKDGINPHDKLTPSFSSKIIQNHVKKGLELAKEYNLPEQIKDAIIQHHGTTAIEFFYRKALKIDKSSDISIYQYPGIKPQTKEMAILMLADTYEAASRALSTKTIPNLKNRMDEVVEKKIKEGQLDECNITFMELEHVKEALIAKVASFFHLRIEYKKEK